jgi:hypothetical protein
MSHALRVTHVCLCAKGPKSDFWVQLDKDDFVASKRPVHIAVACDERGMMLHAKFLPWTQGSVFFVIVRR